MIWKFHADVMTEAANDHIRTGIGMGRRATAFQTIPLCPEHHQGMTGIHGCGRKAWERHIGKTELQLLEEVMEVIA